MPADAQLRQKNEIVENVQISLEESDGKLQQSEAELESLQLEFQTYRCGVRVAEIESSVTTGPPPNVNNIRPATFKACTLDVNNIYGS